MCFVDMEIQLIEKHIVSYYGEYIGFAVQKNYTMPIMLASLHYKFKLRGLGGITLGSNLPKRHVLLVSFFKKELGQAFCF